MSASASTRLDSLVRIIFHGVWDHVPLRAVDLVERAVRPLRTALWECAVAEQVIWARKPACPVHWVQRDSPESTGLSQACDRSGPVACIVAAAVLVCSINEERARWRDGHCSGLRDAAQTLGWVGAISPPPHEVFRPAVTNPTSRRRHDVPGLCGWNVLRRLRVAQVPDEVQRRAERRVCRRKNWYARPLHTAASGAAAAARVAASGAGDACVQRTASCLAAVALAGPALQPLSGTQAVRRPDHPRDRSATHSESIPYKNGLQGPCPAESSDRGRGTTALRRWTSGLERPGVPTGSTPGRSSPEVHSTQRPGSGTGVTAVPRQLGTVSKVK